MDTIAQLFWLTINLYHEARGEPFEGMKAVCHVVLNRAERRKMPVKEGDTSSLGNSLGLIEGKT